MTRNRMTGLVSAIRVIDEQPRQIKQTGKPGHYENNVQGFIQITGSDL
jgi:hypothetical protein